ncbi:MAG: hypothetical protein JWN20_2456 [Jatrophihabitantaceae bacterium]|nr:hypothetical protein [Jatrophihabitantaceae bacterium]
MSAGRLDPDEYGDRVAAASGARFTSDLVPLFADLPSGPPLGAPALISPHLPAPALPGLVEPYIGLSGRQAVGGRVGATIVALSPFIALALFFGLGALGGWSFSWIAFLLVPAAGALVYGSSGGRRRNR